MFLKSFLLFLLPVSVPGLLVPSLRLASVFRRESGRTALHPGLEDPAELRLLPAGGALLYALPPAGPEMFGPWRAHRSGNPGTRVPAPPRVHH